MEEIFLFWRSSYCLALLKSRSLIIIKPQAPPSVLPMRPELYPSAQPDGGLPAGYTPYGRVLFFKKKEIKSHPFFLFCRVLQSQLSGSIQPYGSEIAPEVVSIPFFPLVLLLT